MTIVRFAAAALVALGAAGARASASQDLSAAPGWLPLFNRELVTWHENEKRLSDTCPTDVVRERPDCRAEMLQSRPLPDEIGWVALYNRQLLAWLENANRLDQLCPPSVDVTVERDCRAEKLRPLPYFVPLRNAPRAGADEVGKLMLLAVPGEPLASYYLDADRDDARAFTPDLYLADWGYGPYHHQTYLERRGDWFRLPEDPFPPGAWIDARAFGEPPTVAMLETERVYRSPRGQIVVLAEDADGIRARAEQPADMWCEAGDPPPSAPAPAFRIPKRELYSDTGHLLIAPAYMKGC